jgi:heme/copper-type cytochrome/quinol oxidase subunit 2
MSNAGKLGLAAAGVAVAVVLFFVLRPGDETGATTIPTGTATAPTETTITTTTATTTVTTTVEPEGPEPVRITFQDGEVSGPRRPEFSVGDRVVLIVRSDVADHVHVHGYDLMQDVAPGAPARISFRADAPGRFEVELEDRHLPLTELVVRP